MAVSVQPKIAGLDVLETGIRTLKRSKSLLVTPEFKDMLFAVERHHNDLRLAHLTGKAKDLLDQAQRDTKFYNILVKMLCEVKEKRTGEQRQGLRKVYTWYMANKHVLNTGPHFGKAQMKKEAQEIIEKATTPHKTRHTPSSRWGKSHASQTRTSGQNNRAKSAPSSRIAFHDTSFDWRKELNEGILNSDQPKVERLRLQHDDDNNDDDREPELQRLTEDADTARNTPINTADTATSANTDLLREAHILSRAHHGSPTMTPLGEQSANIKVVVTPRKTIHPISSMVNPHVTLAAKLEQERQEQLQAQRKMGDKQSRADNLQAWQNFNKNRSYGQDIMDRMNFVGRSGTPNDVRYFSHGHAEMPELYTQDVITGYAQVMAEQHANRDSESRSEEQKENVFVQQTLEEFYLTADALYPPSSSRTLSATPTGPPDAQVLKKGAPSTAGSEHGKRRTAASQPNKLGHLLQHDITVEENVRDLRSDEQTTVKLDTVVNIIDSVSEEMTLYKERMAPEAQAGFRQPVASGLPTSHSATPSVRLPSPSARSNSPAHSQALMSASRTATPTRPYSSPLVTRRLGAGIGDDLSSVASSPRGKDRCKSAGVVDWRGRVQPDTMRYKWGKTKFGGYTYLKKHQQKPPNLRSAGSTSAGKRPKTAPVSIRDKWKTEKASDANSRVESQAASHSMTQINQQDVDSMVTVQYLMGSSNSRADSLASLYAFDEEFLRSFRRRPNAPANAPLEFMSIVASSPAAMLADRRHHSQGQPHLEVLDDRDRPEEKADEHLPLPPNLEDLHVPLGEEADVDDNIREDDNEVGDIIIDDALLEELLNQKTEAVVEETAKNQQTDKQAATASTEKPTTKHVTAHLTSDLLPSDVTSDLLPSDVTSDLLPSELTSARTDLSTIPADITSDLLPTQGKVEGQVSGLHQSEKAAEVTSEATDGRGVTPGGGRENEGSGEERGRITYVSAITPKSPVPSNHPRQPLSVSQVWQFTPSQHEETTVTPKPEFILGPRSAQTRPPSSPVRKKVFCSECVSMASTETAAIPKVQRSAGRMPGQAFNASNQMIHLSRRHDELMRRAPPPRTPPSIPMSNTRSSTKDRSPRRGPMMAELEHHARKVKSPRSLMQHVKDLRNSVEGREISSAPPPAVESLMSTLQVCRLRMPLPRQRTMPLMYSNDAEQEGIQSILKQPSDLDYGQQQQQEDRDEAEKVVTFAHSKTPADQTAENSGSLDQITNGLPMPENMSFMRQIASGASSLHSSRSVSLHGSQLSSRHSSEPGTPSSKNLARIGRPIAQVANVPDPGEVAVAVQKQREAAAAVDIQRIFRGYVARSAYKKLISSERRTMEDKQRAAVEIQRVYRGHLSRKRAIERRPVNAEMLEWARDYRAILVHNQLHRQAKAEDRSEELSNNFLSAQSKLSVIGPHVNIYEIYHPKKTGPTKKELHVAAIAIQRHIRGWLIRRRFYKLRRKVAWYGSTFQKMVKDYKGMLARVQRQHGVNTPQTPFTTKEMNEYIDTRKRYESVFEKKAFSGELELCDLESFFKECDLFPSQAEIDEALDVTVRGIEGRGVKRHEMLDMVFYIYTPRAANLVNTRQSTWMNPIIDGVEAKGLIGSEFIEEAPLEVCAQLVIQSKRERREKEQAEERARKDAEFAELARKTKAASRETDK